MSKYVYIRVKYNYSYVYDFYNTYFKPLIYYYLQFNISEETSCRRTADSKFKNGKFYISFN